MILQISLILSGAPSRALRASDRMRRFYGDIFAWGVLPVRAYHHPELWVPLPTGWSTFNYSLNVALVSSFMFLFYKLGYQNGGDALNTASLPSAPRLEGDGDLVSTSQSVVYSFPPEGEDQRRLVEQQLTAARQRVTQRSVSKKDHSSLALSDDAWLLEPLKNTGTRKALSSSPKVFLKCFFVHRSS